MVSMTSQGSPDERTPLVNADEFANADREWKAGLRFARLLTCVTSIAEGYALGVMSGAHELVEDDMDLSNSESAFFIGVSGFAIAVGAPFGGSFADYAGRVQAIAVAYVLIIAGALMMAFSMDYDTLLAGRIVEAIGIGVGLSVVTTYMSEVAPQRIRGELPSLEEFFLVCGIMIGYIANCLLLRSPNGWRWMLGLGAVIPAVFLIPVCSGILPESPRFLAVSGRLKDAREALACFVADDELEMASMEWNVEEKTCSWGDLLFSLSGPDRLALLTSVFVMTMQMLSGVGVLTVFSTSYFSDDYNTDTAYIATALLGAFRLSVLLPVNRYIDHLGRRRMLICSYAGMSVASLILVALVAADVPVVPWHVLGVMLFYGAFSFGAGPVTWVFCGEALSSHIRSKGVALGIFVARIFGGTYLVLYSLMEDDVDMTYIYGWLALVNATGCLVMMLVLPETQGIRLEAMYRCFTPPEDFDH